jgi:hypothetical protein
MEVVSFYCTLLIFYQNARPFILQDINHSFNSSGNISVNSGEIYFLALPALCASNVNNLCTLLVYAEAKNLLVNSLNAELNPICHLLALLGVHHFLHVTRVRVKSLTLRLLKSYIYIYIYGAPILDVSRSHIRTQHSR